MDKDFIDRLEKEFDELGEKINKLDSFVSSEAFNKCSYVQKLLLPIQLDAMMTYHTTLDARLEDLVEE